MAKSLKEAITEFADIAKTCPENLQEKCFVLLLEDFLASHRASPPAKQIPKSDSESQNTKNDEVVENESKGKADADQEDFSETDLHVKARKFLKDSNLTIDHINELFYKEGDNIKPLYEDLRTTRMAESQMRVALLQALMNGMVSGDFEFSGEKVREEVQLRKCYDPPNFSANFKNNKALFEAFEKYDKKEPTVRLSKDGRSELASLIKELQ